MPASLAPAQSDIQAALRSFLLSVIPAGVECIEAQDNRVPEPSGTDFIVMTSLRRERLETNIDGYADCLFIGSIDDDVLTVTDLRFGNIVLGNIVFGTGVTAGTMVVSQSSGTPGYPGTYVVSNAQTIASEKLATGTEIIVQPTRLTYQLDIHSANVGDAADMAETISTVMRDDYAVQFFSSINPNIAPLYADDPRQMPFINAEQQYETRWIVEAVLQANQAVSVSQQFFDDVVLALNNIDGGTASRRARRFADLDFSRSGNSQYLPLMSGF